VLDQSEDVCADVAIPAVGHHRRDLPQPADAEAGVHVEREVTVNHDPLPFVDDLAIDGRAVSAVSVPSKPTTRLGRRSESTPVNRTRRFAPEQLRT
jgi:hypothetical protein